MFTLSKVNFSEPTHGFENTMLENLESFLNDTFDPKNLIWNMQLERIVEFQSEDGSFRVFVSTDDYMPSDAFGNYCTEPTVLCCAILIKAILLCPVKFEKYLPNLERALDCLAKLGINGSGYDYLDVQVDYIQILFDAGLPFFLDRYKDISPAFRETIKSLRKTYASYIENNEFIHGFNENYEEDIRKSYINLTSYRIFIYGTLMKGEFYHPLIESQIYAGESVIKGFNLYSLGSYPGIRPSKFNEREVHGEIYLIDTPTLDKVNRLEGEGTLYRLQFVEVNINDKNVIAGVYVYNSKALRRNRIFSGFWSRKMIYAAYGSNMNTEQMMERCPSAKYLGTTMLDGYRLVFRDNSNGRNVADIEEDPNHTTPLVLWAIDEDSKKELDKYEGVSLDIYQPKKIEIKFRNETAIAVVYVMS